jgi:hypothetical protein
VPCTLPPYPPLIKSEQINFEGLTPTLTKYEYLETPIIEDSLTFYSKAYARVPTTSQTTNKSKKSLTQTTERV